MHTYVNITVLESFHAVHLRAMSFHCTVCKDGIFSLSCDICKTDQLSSQCPDIMEDKMNTFRIMEEASLCDDDDEAEQFRLQLEVGKPCLSSVTTPKVQMRVVQHSS